MRARIWRINTSASCPFSGIILYPVQSSRGPQLPSSGNSLTDAFLICFSSLPFSLTGRGFPNKPFFSGKNLVFWEGFQINNFYSILVSRCAFWGTKTRMTPVKALCLRAPSRPCDQEKILDPKLHSFVTVFFLTSHFQPLLLRYNSSVVASVRSWTIG